MAGKVQKMPPSAFGRFLAAMRGIAYERICSDPTKEELRKEVCRPGKKRLTRLDLERLAQLMGLATADELSEDMISNYETGRGEPKDNRRKALLKVLQLTPEEQKAAIDDPALFPDNNPVYGGNQHLILPSRPDTLLVGEYGALIKNGLFVRSHRSTWVEAEKASSGGFRADEIVAKVLETNIEGISGKLPEFKSLKEVADRVLLENEKRIAKGERGWSNNATLCLDSVTQTLIDDEEERNRIALRFVPSQYKYNVVAKSEQGAEWRWHALQSSEFPPLPVNYLASGVGVCINVICDGGKSIVIGKRSNDETFRKSERDIAVVEGIRPMADVKAGLINMKEVCLRALDEELGLKHVENSSTREIVRRLCIFEFGVDLKFYQWNFLAFAEID